METQRYHYLLMKEGNKACMNPIKIQMLDRIGFDFKYCSWDDFQQLQQVKQDFLNLPHGYNPKQSLQQYIDKILVHPFCNHRYQGGDDDNRNGEQRKINYNPLGIPFYKQQEHCRLFLQGKPCTITKEQRNAIFALQVCHPGKLVEPKPKRLKKSVLVKQEKAALNRQEKQSQDDQLFQQMFQLLTNTNRSTGRVMFPNPLTVPFPNGSFPSRIFIAA
jgi:hypothetical protein